MTVSVFLLCLAAGLACGIAEGSTGPLRRDAGIVFTVIADIFLAFAAVGLFVAVMYFLCDGLFFPYAAAAELLGFLAGGKAARTVVNKIAGACKKHKRKKAKISR